MRYDRDAILARTDLGQLADELLGGHKGSGTGARWPSPVPGHPQTGKTPPMTIFRTHQGVERWTCWATGTSGTAIDLLIVARGMSVAEAFRHLAARAGIGQVARDTPLRGRPESGRASEGSVLSDDARHKLLAYVEACEEHLWSQAGKPMRRWLVETRRLDPDVLLGAGMPNTAVARRLAGIRGVLMLALDGDAAGVAGRATLKRLMADVGREDVLDLAMTDECDLNSCAVRVGAGFPEVLRSAIDSAAAAVRRSAVGSR